MIMTMWLLLLGSAATITIYKLKELIFFVIEVHVCQISILALCITFVSGDSFKGKLSLMPSFSPTVLKDIESYIGDLNCRYILVIFSKLCQTKKIIRNKISNTAELLKIFWTFCIFKLNATNHLTVFCEISLR